MITIEIVFLILAGVFFILSTLMYIVQKVITSKIYSDGQNSIKQKNTKLKSIKDIDTSLLDEIENDEIEEL